MIRTTLSALTLVALVAIAPTSVQAQETAVRFPVAQVGDTTFSFRIGEHMWVRRGLRGIVVDPRQQDVLVARFQIVSTSNSLATAVITGQTTSVSTSHSVLLEMPSTPWYRKREFWLGTAIGAAIGFVLGGL